MLLTLSLSLLLSCAENLQQAVGVGAVYSTACSAEMEARGGEYTARCTPPVCEARFTDLGLSQRVVAVDPGVKVVGVAERTCMQDLESLYFQGQPPVVSEEPGDEPEQSEGEAGEDAL